MDKENIKSFIKSKKTSYTMNIILIIVGVIFVFHLGEEFGFKKAEIMDHMSSGYYRAFGSADSRKNGSLGYLFDDQTGTHGVAGKVVSVIADKILVEDNDGTEKTILVDKNTIIKKQRLKISENEIKPNDSIVVIGSPNQSGQINAKIIRVIQAPTNTKPDSDNQIQTTSSTTIK